MDHVITPLVEWAVASRPLEAGVSGDAYIAQPRPDGALVGVVDGLGHGHAAAQASREAVRLLTGAVDGHPLDTLRLCHEGLRTTRGVVLTLAWVDGSRDCLTWLGVGNVQGVLLRGGNGPDSRQETLVARAGVVGRLLPPLHASLLSISPGDVLVLATDGIHPRFAHEVPWRDHVQETADRIMEEHCTGADDALVLVMRYRGASA